jgi:hypothetical protein
MMGRQGRRRTRLQEQKMWKLKNIRSLFLKDALSKRLWNCQKADNARNKLDHRFSTI